MQRKSSAPHLPASSALCRSLAPLAVSLLPVLLLLLGSSAPTCANSFSAKTYPDAISYKKAKDTCGCMMGPAGTPGIPGSHGHHGPDGRDGRKGDIGTAGLKGEPGKNGEPGVIGPEGPLGKRGRKGAQGDSGPLGSPGVTGGKGERGYPGMTGPRGPKGESPRPTHQIAFSAARSQKLGPVLQDTPITFDVLFSNVGDAFDVYSSQFVCRTNGTYLFTTHILGQNEIGVYAWIMLNDKHKVPLHGDGRAGYGTGSQTIIMTLHNDDHVWVQLSKDSGLLNDYTTFSGYLLFED